MKISDITESTTDSNQKYSQVTGSTSSLNQKNGIQQDVASAVPDLVVFPKLVNTDPYRQYRFGLAMAAANAEKNGEIDIDTESTYGEQMVIVSRCSEEEDIINLARKLYGADANYKHVTSSKSSESDTVNKTSPMTSKGPIAHKSND